MKIIAIGWNYADHNKEMKRENLPAEPTLFMKPDSALLKDGKPFFIPDFTAQPEYETELVFRIGRLGKNIAPRFAHRYYDAVTVGIDITARDLQQRQRAAGAPWETCKAFDGSAVIGTFVPVEQLPEIQDIQFSLRINDELKQTGNARDMIFPIDEIIAYASRFFTLKIGDLIFTGTPAGVGGIHINDHLQGYIGEQKLLDFYIR